MYRCTNCDAQYDKWQGRCSECGKWGTVVEADTAETNRANRKQGSRSPKSITDIMSIVGTTGATISTGWKEMDEVLGGGLMSGSVTLIAGEPGVGKSTLALQLVKTFPGLVLYVSGEENENQVADRAVRLGIRDTHQLRILSANALGDLADMIPALEPKLVIVDSIQTVTDDATSGGAGSVQQVKAVSAQLVSIAKQTGIPCVIVGHVTKDGSVAGPKTLEHVVDTVCYFESDRTEQYRILKVNKHRFGQTSNIAVWSMEGDGLRAVKHIESVFLEPSPKKSGRVIGAMVDGQRAFLVEVQVLVTRTSFAYPERTISGYDLSRLKMLIAILQRYCDISLREDDVFVNVVGGWKVSDPGLDAAVLAALLIAKQPAAVNANVIAGVGEAGLDGTIRSVRMLDARLKAMKTLKDARIFAGGNVDKKKYPDIGTVSFVSDVRDALAITQNASPTDS